MEQWEGSALSYRQRPLSSQTGFTCQIGGENNHSITPLIYSEVFEKTGLDMVYLSLSIPPAQLEDTVRGLKAMGLKAFFVTMPHKRAIMPLLDEIDPAAKAIGAVNLVIREDGRLKGYNGDVTGFMYPLKQWDLHGKKIVFLGSGGAGAACSYGLAQAGGELTILSRRQEHAAALAENLQVHFGKRYPSAALNEQTLERELKDAWMLVNATNVGYGEKSDQTPVPARLLRPDLLVYDIVNAPRTPLIRDAQAAGCRTWDGNDMLAYLSKLFLEALTGAEQPEEVAEISRQAGRKALLLEEHRL